MLLTLTWLILLEPAWQTTSRLRGSLPQLRAQAAQLDAVVQEARELKRQAGNDAALSTPMPAALQASLAQAGLGDGLAAVNAVSASEWRVELDNAPVQALLMWLQGLAFELRLQASAVELERPVAENGKLLSGSVSGTVTLTRAEQP